MSDDAILREKQRRLRNLQEQQSRYGIDTPSQIKTEIEDLAAEIAQLDGSAARAGLPRPPQPDFAHPTRSSPASPAACPSAKCCLRG